MLRVARLAFAALAIAALAIPAAAQDYPNRPVKIIVPFGAGGPADLYARFVGQHLQESLKQSFVIEDRPGAGAMIGTGEVAKAAPDGYTLLMMSNTHTTNETLRPNKPYPADARLRAGGAGQLFRPDHGGAPSRAGEGPEGVPGAAEGEARRAELRLVRPGHALSHGRRAVQSHERDRHRARAAQGSGEARNSRDRRPRADDDRRHHHDGADRGGRARCGRWARPARNARSVLPDVPTVAEAGVPGYEATIWLGIMAPANTPKPIVDKLNAEINKVLQPARRSGRPGPSRAPCRSS